MLALRKPNMSIKIQYKAKKSMVNTTLCRKKKDLSNVKFFVGEKLISLNQVIVFFKFLITRIKPNNNRRIAIILGKKLALI